MKTNMDTNGFMAKHRDTTKPMTESGGDLLVEEFPVNIPNQNYALISYLGPKTLPSASWFGLRIYGTFSTMDEANRAATKARDKGFTNWDLFVVDICHGFFPMPPPCESAITDVQYDSEVLTKLMKQDQKDVNDAKERVASRAAGEVQLKSASDTIDELAQTAYKVFNDSTLATDSTVLLETLKNEFRQISDFM